MSTRWVRLLLQTIVAFGHGLVLVRLIDSAIESRTIRLELTQARGPERSEQVAVLIPVYNEQPRLAPCLEGAIQQPPDLVRTIVVVDTGSNDWTERVVAAYRSRDARVLWLDAGAPPNGCNGKVWGLHRACQHVDADWYLVLDADVRPDPMLAPRLLAAAQKLGAACVSVALTQTLMPDRLSWLLHPAFLATLVYRYGVPGRVTTQSSNMLVNGQTLLLRRDAVQHLDGLRAVARAVAEDIAIGRRLARSGYRVAFLEPVDRSFVTMYPDGKALWRSWPRSLPATDEQPLWHTLLDFLLLLTTQAAWLPLLLLSWRQRSFRSLAAVTTALRLGTAIGMRRAYRALRWWYWLAPLMDPLVVARLLQEALVGTPTWRGRVIERGKHA